MPKSNGSRLGDVSALVRASATLSMPGSGDGNLRRRRLVAMFCSMLGEQVLEGKPVSVGGPPLSQRQRQTLDLLLAGNAEKQIAAALRISKHTVHVYVKSLYKRFGVNSRPELLAKWVRN
ncbi:MAG TPA: helix-turn-helix transcriptional regulator [Tepidisphaeraceae bacterium]|jgi:DNA-binding CsgD family transcriptional regulator